MAVRRNEPRPAADLFDAEEPGRLGPDPRGAAKTVAATNVARFAHFPTSIDRRRACLPVQPRRAVPPSGCSLNRAILHSFGRGWIDSETGSLVTPSRQGYGRNMPVAVRPVPHPPGVSSGGTGGRPGSWQDARRGQGEQPGPAHYLSYRELISRGLVEWSQASFRSAYFWIGRRRDRPWRRRRCSTSHGLGYRHS